MEHPESPEDLHRELRELSQRVERVERLLGLVHRRVPPPEPLSMPTPPTEAAAVPPAVPADAPPIDAPLPTQHIPRPSAPAPVAAPLLAIPPAVAARAVPTRSLEGLVGGRYFLAAGAIVVVIGVGLFLKLGYDQGWFAMSNAWKCICGGLFGLLMIAGGELARRTINVLAGSGLSAAGLGALYLSVYAAHGFYSLIGPTPAFLFLALITVLGVVIAVVSRQAGVAVLAMLGGYLAPFLLNVDHPNVLVIPLHSLALLATGLILSGWKPEIFRVLRSVAWWGTVVLGTLWMIFQGVNHALIALPFLIVFWGAVHAELIISVRGQHDPDSPTDDDSRARNLLLRWSSVRPIGASISTSVWTVFFGIAVLRAEPILPDWFAPAGAMAAAALLAMTLAGHLRVLRDSPRTDAQRLGAGLAMQAGALLIVAVALAFSGSIEVIAWLAVGMAAVGAAAWIGAPSLAIYGLISLGIAAVRLVTYDAFVTRRTFTSVSLANLALDHWTLLMALCAGAWIGAALLILRLRDTFHPDNAAPRISRRTLFALAPNFCTGVGLALLLASFVHPQSTTGAISVAWIAVGVLASIARLFERRIPLALHATLVLTLATAAWMRAYITPGWSSAGAGAVHPGMLVGALLALVTATLAVWYRRDRVGDGQTSRLPAHLWILYAVWAVLMVWGVSSLEIYRLVGRAERVAMPPLGAISLWWGIFAAAILALGFRLRVDAVRLTGLVVMAAALLAWSAAFPVRGWASTAAGALIHPGFIIAMLMIVALAAVARRWRGELSSGDVEARVEVIILIAVASVMLWLATSLDVFRLAARFRAGAEAQHGALSVWWGLFAVALLAAGFRWRAAPARYAGLALLGIATLKALIIDLADVSAGWRVVSVLGLGLLMLGVALVYVRTSARLLNAVHPEVTVETEQ